MQNSLNDFRSALFAGDFNLAENIGLVQIQQLGETSQWMNELGLLYLMKGDLPEALRYFDRAVEIDSHFIEAQLNAAIILSDLGFYEEASERFAKASQNEGVILAQKYFEMGLFFISMLKYSEAEIEFKKAIALHRSAEYFIELARLYIEQENFSEALFHLDNALMEDSKNTIAESLKGQCQKSQKNFESRDSAENASVV